MSRCTPITPVGRNLLSACKHSIRRLIHLYQTHCAVTTSQIAYFTGLLQNMALLLLSSGHDGAAYSHP